MRDALLTVARTVARQPVVRTLLTPILPRVRLMRREWERPHFAKAYRAHLRRQLGHRHPRRRAFREYALLSLERGAQAAALVQRYRDVRGTRHLDIGSAYGGFSIAFVRGGARESVGVEPDADLLGLSHALLRDFPCAAQLIQGDSLDASFMASLGVFDVITCNDVLEHVEDPWALIRHMAAALRPGGVAYVAMPNNRAFDHVLADPHYGLFGISLLRREDARRYYDQVRDASWQHYDVAEFYPLAEYRKAMALAGLDATIDPDPPHSVEELADSVRDLERTAEARIPSTLDGHVRQLVRHAVAAYVGDFWVAYGRREPDDLLLNYASSVWRVLARKLTQATEPGERGRSQSKGSLI